MNPELTPALVAAGGGAAALGGIYFHERRRDEAMRRDRKSFSLTFPLGVRPDAATSALASLTGNSPGTELVFEIHATASGITHRFACAEALTTTVVAHLTAALPGLRVRPADSGPGAPTTLVTRVYMPPRAILRTDDAEIASRSLLAGLGHLQEEDEHVVVRWAFKITSPVVKGLPDAQSPEDQALVRALRKRSTEPGFGAAGLVLVRASSIARARLLAEHVGAVLRSRRSFGSGLHLSSERGNRTLAALPRTRRSSGWLSVAEVLPLLGWPLGDEWIEGVRVGASREVRASRDLPRLGRQLFVARDGGGDRPVALPPKAALLHQLVVGPTGTGKSTVIARGVLDDLEHGHGGVVIDPKNDLAASIAERVPDRHVDRVVVLDPGDPRPVPGLDLLGVGDPDLRSDVVLGALRSIFRDSWGVRSDYYGRLALRTLSEVPGATLADFGRLFSEPGFRRAALTHQSDPMTVAAWQTFEALSPGEQVQHVQAPLSKVMALISRPALRAVLAQPAPKLDIAGLLAERKWLLASLAPGALGEPAARLLGAVLAFVVWTALEARISLPPEKRTPVFLVFDELQALTDLPLSIERMAERARGLGGGLVVGTQTVGRLPKSTRTALLGNLSTLIAFRCAAEEANRLARELPGLTAQDLMSLESFAVAARVASGSGSAVRVVTGRTEPLPPVTGNADKIRARSAERYGVDRAAIDEHLRRQYSGESGPPDEGSIGRTRRRS